MFEKERGKGKDEGGERKPERVNMKRNGKKKEWKGKGVWTGEMGINKKKKKLGRRCKKLKE